MTVVLFHSGSRSVEETTYLRMPLIWSLAGSPDRVGQTGAKPSYVRRPITRASQDSRRSVWIASAASSPGPDGGHVWGSSMTPSREM